MSSRDLLRWLLMVSVPFSCAENDAADTSGTSTGEPATTDSNGEVTDTGATSGTTSGSDGVSESSSTGGFAACELDDHFMCDEAPYACDAIMPCGPATSWFDDDGCLREECVDGQCAEGFRCFEPAIECDGLCVGPRPNCDETHAGEQLVCSCGQDGSCTGAICVPEEKFTGDYCGA